MIRALFDQQIDGINMPMFCRSKKRRSVLNIGEIHVCLAAEQQRHGARVVVARGGEQRRAALDVDDVDGSAGVEKKLEG